VTQTQAHERHMDARDRIHTPDGRPYTFLDLAVAAPEALEEVMRFGWMPDARRLAGSEFRGYNALDLTAVIGIRRFRKGFEASPAPAGPRDALRGYDVQVVQGGIGAPWDPVLRRGAPIRHSFHGVRFVDPSDRDNLYPNAAFLDYGAGGNPLWDPSRTLRDYLVQVYPDDPDLLLGRTYVALGPARIPVSYFVLERLQGPDRIP